MELGGCDIPPWCEAGGMSSSSTEPNSAASMRSRASHGRTSESILPRESSARWESRMIPPLTNTSTTQSTQEGERCRSTSRSQVSAVPFMLPAGQERDCNATVGHDDRLHDAAWWLPGSVNRRTTCWLLPSARFGGSSGSDLLPVSSRRRGARMQRAP